MYKCIEGVNENGELNINRKEIPIGEVAYYARENSWDHRQHGSSRYSVHWGIVENHYLGEVCLQLYEPFDRRMINGIPIKEFRTPTEWQKLPKGWTYSTQLYELGWNDWKEDIAKNMPCRLDHPEDLKAAIEEGLFVKVQDNDHCEIGTEIDKHGFRIVRSYPMGKYYPTYASVRCDRLYRTYDEAQKWIDEYEAELNRQAALSDYEWSVELIDKTIAKAKFFGYITEDQAVEAKERLLAMDDVENLHTRVGNGKIEYRYERHKRWYGLEF